jgi:hypothetical protein
MTDQEKFEDSIKQVKSFAPNFNTILKKDSKLHQLIGKIFAIFGNPDYMTYFWTTISSTVARPSICNDGPIPNEWQIIFHEGRHASDANKISSTVFDLIYLFPLWIGLLGLLYSCMLVPVLLLGGPLSLLWGLLLLLGLLPLPAIGRTILEIRGYLVTLCVEFWSGNLGDEETAISWIVMQFTGPSYYYMFPFTGFLTRYFQKKLRALKDGSIELDNYLRVCKTKCFQHKTQQS